MTGNTGNPKRFVSSSPGSHFCFTPYFHNPNQESHKLQRGIFLLLLLAVLSYPIGAQQRRWLAYETPVDLSGTVKTELRYGPPNFGENPRTDQKERIYVLVLDKPINVMGSAADPLLASVKGAKIIQLVIAPTMPLSQFLGKKTRVQGKLFHAHNGHHHHSLLMDMNSIK